MTESLSLYRRHRPGSFDEVVGQQHVVRTLRNAVERDKVHHAYLFVGSRGTGKTSMAKILARSLNCERGGPTVTPCGECESCLTIAAGTSIDVIEMDAASNRSVDDVRDLRERVAYAPAGGHWKVYILDEAHMLTKEAWNAFLKTLEEPPPKTVFVLATTEAHKVMPTIADRCQRFDFQRPSLEQISEVLQRVAAAESIEVDEGAVATIARSASGSFRDALGTLDQLVAFGGGGTFGGTGNFGGGSVTLEMVLEMLGAADAELLFEAVDAVAAADPKAVLLGVEKMARSGRDPAQFARDLLAHLRFLLVTQTTGEVPTSFVVTATDAGRLQAQASAVGPATLVRTIDELAAALTAIREGDEARMAVEIALLKAARPDLDPGTEGLLRRIERLETQLAGGAGGAGPVGAASPTVLGAGGASAPRGTPAPPPPAPATAQPDDSPPANAGEPEPTEPSEPPPPEAEPPSPPPAWESDPGPDADAPPAGGAVGGPAPEDALATAGGGGSPAAAGPADRGASVDVVGDAAAAGPAGRDAPVDSVNEPAGDGAPLALDLDEIKRIWPSVLDHLAQKAPALAATFEGARPVAFDEEGGLQIGFPADKTFNKRKAEDPERRDAVAEAFAAVAGQGLRPSYVLLEGKAAEAGAESPAVASGGIDEDALVERLKSEFDAEEVS